MCGEIIIQVDYAKELTTSYYIFSHIASDHAHRSNDIMRMGGTFGRIIRGNQQRKQTKKKIERIDEMCGCVGDDEMK